MMSVFGNGVIDGWEVSQTGAFTIAVSEGHGNINYMSARSTFPSELTVPPSSISYIYAKIVRSTRYSEEVSFVSSTTTITDPNFILLAEVSSGVITIESIDNTVRRSIRFAALIRDAIAQHKHRGGTDNASKIDLSSEVKGQLPGFRIADIDADKIASGTFDLARLPLINHQDLQNIGMLTHPQLDTFVKTLETSNKELFGEVGSSNLLQMIIALKLIYDTSTSVFDANFINEFAIIPGVTPDDRIDFDNSTAIIDTDNNYIEGQASQLGSSFYVRWEDALAWSTALNVSDVDISGDDVVLLYDPDAAENTTYLDTFETTTPAFTHQEIPIKDGQYVSKGQGVDDSGGALLDAGSTHISTFTWSFSEPQSWVQFGQFLMDIKCESPTPENIYFFFMDSEAGSLDTMFELTDDGALQPHRTPDQILLGQGDDTLNGKNGFLTVDQILSSIDRTTFSIDSVKSIVIWTLGTVIFTIDNLRLTEQLVLPEYGSFKLRYSTSSQVTFQRIEYDADTPGDSLVKVRSRAANSTAMLNRAEWTHYLATSEDVVLAGTDLELEVTLYAKSSRALPSPQLNWIRIVVVTDAEMDGFTINTQDEFSRGDTDNITVEDSIVSITTPISVGSYYYAGSDKIVQVYRNTTVTPNRTDGENSVFAVKAPIAPNQVFRSMETGVSVTESSFFNPRSAVRMTNKTFVVADTYNDRILHFDSDGILLEGFGSVNYSHTSMTFPVSACIDIRTGILYVVWSRSVDFAGVKVAGFSLKNGATTIPLLPGFDLINNKQQEDLSDDKGQVMEIHLSEQTKAMISSWPTTGCLLAVSGNVIPEGVGNSDFYRKVATTGRLPLFIGNFWYTQLGSPENIPVFSPTYAEKTELETYVYTNSTVAVKDFSYDENIWSGDAESVTLNTVTFPSVIEIDPGKSAGQKITFTSDSLRFSPFIPGRAMRVDDSTMLVAGLSRNGTLKTLTDGLDFRNINGTSENKSEQKQKLQDTFFDEELVNQNTAYRGAIRLVSTLQPGGTEIFQYNSPKGLLVSDACLDSSGNIIAAESCFVGQSGRIIKLDGSGNITFSWGEGTFGMINDVQIQQDTSESWIVVTT